MIEAVYAKRVNHEKKSKMLKEKKTSNIAFKKIVGALLSRLKKETC